MSFFRKYVEVTPPSRLVWTNDEGGESGAVTTVTFEEKKAARRSSLCAISIPHKKLSTMQSPPGVQVAAASNWTSFSSPQKRAWDGDEVVEVGGRPVVVGRFVHPWHPCENTGIDRNAFLKRESRENTFRLSPVYCSPRVLLIFFRLQSLISVQESSRKL